MAIGAMRRSRAYLAVALAGLIVAAPLAGEPQQAVQPGGDIPAKLPPSVAIPVPAGADFQSAFKAPRGSPEFVRREAMIPMRDGTRLFAVVILPRHARNAPIMLDRTPYSADKATTRGGGGPWPESILTSAYAELVRAGYILVIEDVRGKYRSQGDYVMNRPLAGPLNATGIDHSTDAWDTIDWLVKHTPESNDRVGTIGTSYDGFTALMSLINPHPALKASVPINPMVDVWKGDDWFHNGAFREEMISYVYGQTAARDSDESWFRGGLDDYSTYLGYGSASAYGDSLGMKQLPFWQRLAQHPDYDEYWQGQAVDRLLGRHGLAVPTLFVGSMWDQEDIYGAAAAFAAVKSSPNAFFALGPWYHGQVNGPGLALGPVDWGSDTARWFRLAVMIPFLDRYLKDPDLNNPKPAGIAKVTAFEAGPNVWRGLADWPLACARGCASALTPLYLQRGSSLGFAAPRSPGRDSYVSDPAKPVTYRARPNLSPWATGSSWRTWLSDDQRFADGRPDVLTYSGPVLAQPLHLAGTPLAHLVASTTGSDSDWVVKLIDVYPSFYPQKPELGGYQFAIAMDVMRGRYRNDPAHPSAVPANVPVTYEFALPTVDYVVAPGHRLMVQVQSSWFPLYDRNPQTFVPNIFFAKAGDYRAATQTVLTGPAGSWVGLPMVH